jgi:hypothetical protein
MLYTNILLHAEWKRFRFKILLRRALMVGENSPSITAVEACTLSPCVMLLNFAIHAEYE